MHVIRISDEAMERLKKWAEPLVDTPESALNKALDAAERNLPPPDDPPPSEPERVRLPSRGRSGDKLPQNEFRRPLMEVLYELGGAASVGDLRPILEERLRDRLRPGDYKPVSTGAPRWWHATQWARNGLKNDGYLRDDSPRGRWELSEKGVREVERWLSKKPTSFVNHLQAMPNVGEDSDFDRPRTGPRGNEH